MIHSFLDAETEALFHSRTVPRFRNFERVARRKLLQLHAATLLETLKVPPGNHLEALTRDRKGQYSIRVNDQWRICFVWRTDGAHHVEIVDYH
jgi:toxin HigB-1